MVSRILALGLLMASLGAPFSLAHPSGSETAQSRFVLLVHGGAGVIPRDTMTPEREALAHAGLRAALDAGHRVLAAGGAAEEAVIAAIRVLEDDPQFNAGRGAVFTADATHELDACLMVGRDRSVGAVAGVRTVRHPILLADGARRRTPHVLFAGEGAERLADELGLERVENSWFSTDFRREQLEARRAADAGGHQALVVPEEGAPGLVDRMGTVGAVALDVHGNLAAGTSTGGMTNKRPGRVGDSPIPGSGNWADTTVAVSCTGTGESFIKAQAAAMVSARMRLAGETLEQAVAEVLADVGSLGGSGGLIAVGADGSFALPFTTGGMYRGSIDERGEPRTAVFADPDVSAPGAPGT